MSRRPTLRPCLETLESVTLLSSLPLHPQLPAVAHTERASNMAHELVQLPLTGSSVAGLLVGKDVSGGKKFELDFQIGHFYEVGTQGINSNTPASGLLKYTKKTNGTFVFDSASISIHNVTTGGELILKLTLPKAAKGENASNVSQFEYSVTKATKGFAGTQAEGNKLITFTQLWPPATALTSANNGYSGTFE